MRSIDLLHHYRRVSQQQLTVVDVETTGYTPPNGRVIEIAILHATLQSGIQQQETYLINPEVSVPEHITRFTGITQAMVDQALLSTEVWQRVFPLLDMGVLTAHNLAFDYSFIKTELAAIGLPYMRPPEAQLCTVQLSRLMLPDLPSRSLPNLVRHFQFPVGRSHRAEADTIACWLLAERLLTEIQQEADEVLLERFAQQRIPLGEVATILGCSGKQARALMSQAGIEPRLVGRSKTPMYQRGIVEQVLNQTQRDASETSAGSQLSWL